MKRKSLTQPFISHNIKILYIFPHQQDGERETLSSSLSSTDCFYIQQSEFPCHINIFSYKIYAHVHTLTTQIVIYKVEIKTNLLIIATVVT